MRRIIVAFLISFVAWAHAKELVANHFSDAQDMLVDQLFSSTFDRAHKASPLTRADLDDTTVGKPSNLAAGPGMGVKPLVPRRPYQSLHTHPFSAPGILPSPKASHRPQFHHYKRPQIRSETFQDVLPVVKVPEVPVKKLPAMNVSLPHVPVPKVETFTAQEVARHNTPQDCWVIVKDKVYDVSPYVSQHPGGPLIAVKAGGDCTQIFKSYHLNGRLAEANLNKYYKGELDVPSILDPFVRYNGEEHGGVDGEDEEFYRILKARVARYFKDNNLSPTLSVEMIVKSFAILATLGASWYAAFMVTGVPFAASFVASLFYGFAAAQCGMSIMHDANHGSYTKNEPFKALMSMTMDLVGVSSFMWRQQHVIGHHCFTNVDGRDPDIAGSQPIGKLAPKQETKWWHRYQKFYLPILYGVMTAKAIYFDDFVSLFTGRMGPLKLQKQTWPERAVFWGFKTLYFSYMWVIPLMFGPHGLLGVIAMHMALNAVNGYVLATIFQVAHVTNDVEYPEEQSDTGRVKMGFAEAQVRTSADFCVDSRFWMHVTGGLSHQIEHHLFPGVCHTYYPNIAPIVEQTCKEFNIPYVKYPTFQQAVQAHWAALDKFGITDKSPKTLHALG